MRLYCQKSVVLRCLVEFPEMIALWFDVDYFPMWVCCPILSRAVVDEQIDLFAKYILQCRLVVDVRLLAWFCGQIVSVLHGCHVSRLQISQIGRARFGDSLIIREFVPQIVYHLWVIAEELLLRCRLESFDQCNFWRNVRCGWSLTA